MNNIYTVVSGTTITFLSVTVCVGDDVESDDSFCRSIMNSHASSIYTIHTYTYLLVQVNLLKILNIISKTNDYWIRDKKTTITIGTKIVLEVIFVCFS